MLIKQPLDEAQFLVNASMMQYPINCREKLGIHVLALHGFSFPTFVQVFTLAD